MTIYRAPGTIDAVLFSLLGELTPAEIKAATGKGANHFYDRCNPNTDWGLWLEDALAFDILLRSQGKPARFLAAYTDMLRAATAVFSSTPADLGAGLLNATVQLGELAAAYQNAMDDNKLTLNERRRIAKEAQDVADSAIAIRDAVEPPVGNVSPLSGAAE